MRYFAVGLAALAALMLLPAQNAAAQAIGVKPGLWKMTAKVDMGGIPVMPNIDMSQIPPERRAMVEEMMKRNSQGQQEHTSLSCVTPHDLEATEFYKNDNPNCKNTVTSHSSMGWSGTVVCTGAHPAKGDMKFTAANPESLDGIIHMSMVDEKGAPHQTTVNISGKWQAAECGDVQGK